MKQRPHSRLWLYFAGLVFATIGIVIFLIFLVWTLLFRGGYLPVGPQDRHVPVLLFLIGSLLLGAVIALFVGKLIIRPIQNISNAFDELSRGNFDVQVCEEERLAETREIARRFNAMVHDLSNIETLRSDFVANVSHEFKTPISAISGYATLLQNHSLPRQRQDDYIEKILDNSRKLSNLSSDLLMLSRLENQELVTDSHEFRLDEQLRRTILLHESRWSEKELEFDLELPRQMYRGSEALLERVWSNLIDNAIKFSPPGGIIHIRLEQTDRQLRVTVADEGVGMSPEVQKHIFEKFYQGDPSRREEGSGLGLAMVRRIVELSRGQILVSSTPGAGASFTVLLPTT